MSKFNLKLHVAFDFEVAAPDVLLSDDHRELCKRLNDGLGALVFQGMPTVTGKQLAKLGATIIAHHYHLDAENLASPPLDRVALVAAGPHLTDAELDQLANLVTGKAPTEAIEQHRFLRRQALALINEYRLVPCQIEGKVKTGGNVSDITLEATLNLTNGSVMVLEQHRQNRLQQGSQAVSLVAADGAVRFKGACEGHTLSGPVINVAISDIAQYRNALVQLWQSLH